MTGKHRQSEVILRQSDRLMILSSQAPPTSMRLKRRVSVSRECYSVSQDYGGQVYVGGIDGVDRVTCDSQSSRVISLDGVVCGVSVNDGVIYTLVNKSDSSWSVRVYGSKYQLILSWRHNEDSKDDMNQLAVSKVSVLVPHRNSKTIIQYSLTGEVERRIPCLILMGKNTWMCGMSSHRDIVVVSCDSKVSCIDVSTGHCVWSTDSLEKPSAVCSDDADRVYAAFGGWSGTTQISVLDRDTGKSVLTS